MRQSHCQALPSVQDSCRASVYRTDHRPSIARATPGRSKRQHHGRPARSQTLVRHPNCARARVLLALPVSEEFWNLLERYPRGVVLGSSFMRSQYCEKEDELGYSPSSPVAVWPWTNSLTSSNLEFSHLFLGALMLLYLPDWVIRNFTWMYI